MLKTDNKPINFYVIHPMACKTYYVCSSATSHACMVRACSIYICLRLKFFFSQIMTFAFIRCNDAAVWCKWENCNNERKRDSPLGNSANDAMANAMRVLVTSLNVTTKYTACSRLNHKKKPIDFFYLVQQFLFVQSFLQGVLPDTKKMFIEKS